MDKWEKFWKDYRDIPVKENGDLCIQVGKTVGNTPIRPELLSKAGRSIAKTLSLTKEDILIELCCGNGLITSEVAESAGHVFAFDFTERFISTAIEHKKSRNITYFIESAREEFSLTLKRVKSNKFLMHDALAYFSVGDLEHILSELENISGGDFLFYLTEVPDDNLKYNFYDTPERREEYLKNDEYNKGMGRWWKREEIIEISKEFNLEYNIKDNELYNYRMDVLLRSTK
jgi:predicted TPR repeat methyltransferase